MGDVTRSIVPVRMPVVAVPGRTAAIEIDPEFAPVGNLQCVLDDGSVVPGRVVLLKGDLRPDPAGWLSDVRAWRVLDRAGAVPDDARALLVVRFPLTAVGQSVRVRGQRLNVQWLPRSSQTVGQLAGAVREALGPPASVSRGGSTENWLRLLDSDATQRWRAQLVRGTLGSTAELRIGEDGFEQRVLGGSDVAIDDDEAIEAWANSFSDRVRFALAEVYRVDPGLNAELREALGGFVRFSTGETAPAWQERTDPIETLLTDIVVSGRTAEKANRIRAIVGRWVSESNRLVAWVVSDAGGEFGAEGGTIGVCSFESQEVRVVSGDTLADRFVTAPRQSLVRRVGGSGEGLGVRVISEDANKAPVDLELYPHLPVRPPGLRGLPLARDWSLRSWTGGTPEPDIGTRITLLRVGPLDDPTWRLVVECDSTSGAAPDTLTLRFGDREFVIERNGTPPTDAVLVDRGESWQVMIDGSVGDDGRALLGIKRLRSDGRRTAWPRPMLPWQRSGPVMLIDGSAWDD